MRTSPCLYTFLLLSVFSFSCKKSSFLNANPDQSLLVPGTLPDCQALLDDDRVINGFGNSGYPSLGETGSDDYTVSPEQYGAYSAIDQQAVIWARTIYTSGEVNDWDLPYRVVYTANVVLTALDNINPGDNQLTTWKNIRGSALFYRAFAFYQLAQIFAPTYDSSTAGTDWGLPLRLSADANEQLSRATVQQTYDRILQDLSNARTLLPKDTLGFPTRPSRAAVYGLLSRVYLSARDYHLSLLYADSCLQLQHALMNYDTISTTALFPFNRFNSEVIFSAAYFSSGPSATYKSYVDSFLLQSYQTDDLRKKLFFKFGNYFFGRYDQEGYNFSGIATDEMWLTRAECYARAGNTTDAMNDLNNLLQTRWAAGAFIPYTATDANDALQQILLERRKELLFRGTRWTDLRRLNKDTRTALALTRTVNNVAYTLPPGDPRYVYAIPDNVLSFNPGMPQNQR